LKPWLAPTLVWPFQVAHREGAIPCFLPRVGLRDGRAPLLITRPLQASSIKRADALLLAAVANRHGQIGGAAGTSSRPGISNVPQG